MNEWLVCVCGWTLIAGAMMMVLQFKVCFDQQHAMLQVQRRSMMAMQYLKGHLRMAGQLHCGLEQAVLRPVLAVHKPSLALAFVKDAQSDVVVMRQCDLAHSNVLIKTAFFVAKRSLADQESSPSSLYMQYQGGVRQALVPGVMGMKVTAYDAQGAVAQKNNGIAALSIQLRVCADQGVWTRTGRKPYCELWPVWIVSRVSGV